MRDRCVTLASVPSPPSDDDPTHVDIPIVVVCSWHRRVWRFLTIYLPVAVLAAWRETELE